MGVRYTDIFDFIARAPLKRINDEEVRGLIIEKPLNWTLYHRHRGNIEQSIVTMPWLISLFGENVVRKTMLSDTIGRRVLLKINTKYAACALLAPPQMEKGSQPSQSQIDAPPARLVRSHW